MSVSDPQVSALAAKLAAIRASRHAPVVYERPIDTTSSRYRWPVNTAPLCEAGAGVWEWAEWADTQGFNDGARR